MVSSDMRPDRKTENATAGAGKGETGAPASPSTAPSSGQGNNPEKKSDMIEGELGQMLRSVYQRAISEDIPPEMLDLLGKLD